MLGDTGRDWAYPLSTCYSAADEIVSLDQLDDPRFDVDAELQNLWEWYQGPKGGFDDLAM